MTNAISYRLDPDVDLEQLAALFVTAGWEWRARDRDHLAGIVAGSRFVISAWDGERLVGFARAISDGVSNAYVSNVAVLPEYKGRGIGRQLIERLTAGQPGIKWVLHSRVEVMGFYRKMGFEDAADMMWKDRA